MKIGFIGQGWVGKNYADDFEERGFEIVRYSLEDEYKNNKDKIKECDFVFIAVPTPTTPKGFDASIVNNTLRLVGRGKVAIIKSTMSVGKTREMQDKHPDIVVLHSPEFLTEKTAQFDAKHPKRNIIGYCDALGQENAKQVANLLPTAAYKAIVPVEIAEMVKYGGNCWFYFKVIFMNLLWDLCESYGLDFEMVKEAMSFDTRIGTSHLDPVHQGGRGAGGHCFIKDFAEFADMYSRQCPDDAKGNRLLKNMEAKNIELLLESGKDLEILAGVYELWDLETLKK